MNDLLKAKVVIYVTEFCPYCDSAKALLKKKGVDYEEVNLNDAPHLRDEVIRWSGRRTLPQIFVNGKSVGGFDDLRALDKAGELDRILKD